MFQDSLAAEIEGTMRKELSLDDPECKEQKYVHLIGIPWNVAVRQPSACSVICFGA